MNSVVHALEKIELWMENSSLRKAMKSFGAGVSSERITEAMQINYCNAIAARVIKALAP